MSQEVNEFEAVAIGDDQLTPWPRVAAVASMVAFSLPTFVTGLEVYRGLSQTDTVWALIIGSLIIFGVGAAMGGIGSTTRLSSYLLTRIAFGDKGAGIVNIAFAISLLGWFGININLFADAVGGLCEQRFGTAPPEAALALLAAFCMTATTYLGFRAINILATLMVPVLAIVTAILIWRALGDQSLSAMMTAEKDVTLTLGQGVSAIVGAIIVGAIILPDITRFVRHWSGAVGVAVVAYLIVELIVMIAAALAGAATGEDDMIAIMLTYGLGVGAFVIVIAGSWVLNSLNLYSTVLSTKATFPALNRHLLVAGLGIVGAGAGLLNLLDHFVVFLLYLSIVFVPVAGVIMVDFLIIRRSAYRVDRLDQNRGFAPKALLGWLIGAAIALAMSEGVIPSVTGMGALDAIIAAGLAYLALAFNDRTNEPSTEAQ